jgi:sporulation protein YlmC with PRC-barrel domain
MKEACKAISLAVIGLFLANGALAQSTAQERRSSDRDTAVMRRDAGAAATKEWEQQHRASKIMGTDVYDMKGEKIGSVRDIVVDPRTGNINYAVVSFGGVMGVGGKYFAVPWKSMRPTEDAKNYALNVDREALKVAPGFDKDHWPDMANQQWATDVERYWQSRQSTGSSDTSRGERSGRESRESR